MESSSQTAIDPWMIINGHLIEATVELFGAYGSWLAHAASNEEPTRTETGLFVIGNAGYKGDGIRGGVTIFAEAPTARALSARLISDTTDATLCDTIGEFSNMLLGRLKNRLLQHDVVLSMATPTSAIGTWARVFSAADGIPCWHHFVDEWWSVFVRLDLTLDRDFAMAASSDPCASVATEDGDVLLF